MEKVIQLTERDLTRIVKKVILEQDRRDIDKQIKHFVKEHFYEMVEQNPKIKDYIKKLKNKLRNDLGLADEFKDNLNKLEKNIIKDLEIHTNSDEMNEGISDFANKVKKSLKRFIDRNWDTMISILFSIQGASFLSTMIYKLVESFFMDGKIVYTKSDEKYVIGLLISTLFSTLITYLYPFGKSPFRDEFKDEE
jgi:hypothetical protein